MPILCKSIISKGISKWLSFSVYIYQTKGELLVVQSHREKDLKQTLYREKSGYEYLILRFAVIQLGKQGPANSTLRESVLACF